MTAESPLVRSASKERDKERDKDNRNLSLEREHNRNLSLEREHKDKGDSPREREKDKDTKGEKEKGEKDGYAEKERDREVVVVPQRKETLWGDEDTEPAEAIVKVLWGDFKAQTKRKIDEVMAFGIDEKFQLSDVFAMKADPGYHHLIDSLGELAKHSLNVLAGALLQWKANQHTSPASLRAKIEDSASKTSVKEGILNMLEERHQLAVDYIFCTTFLVLLNALTRENLLDSVATQIEQCCFEFFKMERRQSQQYIIINASWIPDLYAFVLSALSTYRLKSISARFFKELGVPLPSNSARQKAISILQGIRYLKMKITSKHSLTYSNEVLLNFIDILKQAKVAKGDVRRAIFETLATLLKPLAESEFAAGLNYMDWYTSIRDLWDRASRKTKKTKDIVITYPLLAVLLAASDPEFFSTNFSGLLETLLKVKDKAVRPFALEALRYLLVAYLSRNIEGPDEVYDRLQMMVSFVFPFGSTKRLTSSDKEPLDIFVDIITYIANSRIDFAVQNIIFELLKMETKEILAPERMLVGLRATQIIHTPLTPSPSDTGTLATAPAAAGTAPIPLTSSISSTNTTHTSTLSSFIIPDLTFKSRSAARIFTLTSGGTSTSGSSSLRMVSQNTPTKSRRRFAPGGLEPYYKNLGAFLSQILLSLDAAFGSHLYTQSKPLAELLEKSKTPGVLGLELLKLAITCIPIAFPAKIPVSELVTMLAKFLIHLDKGIREKSSEILAQLMESKPELRAAIVYGLGKFALSIHDLKHPIIAIVLTKQANLLKQWVAIIKRPPLRSRPPSRESIREPQPVASATSFNSFNSNSSTSSFLTHSGLDSIDDFDPALVEAVALVFLCSPYPKIRALCMEVLSAVRTIHASAREAERSSYEELVPTRLMDIVDETGPDIISRLQQGGGFENRMDDKHRLGHKTSEKTLDRLVGSDSRDDQFCWTFCLAELAKVAVELVPEVVSAAWPILATRIRGVQPEEGSSSTKAATLTWEQETLVVWWRNYIVIACAIVPYEPSSRTSSPTSFSSSTVKHNSHSLISNISVMDMENVPAGPRDLFEKIMPYIKSVYSDSYKEAAIMALERSNLASLPILFEILRPQEVELLNLKKGRKKNDRLRNILGLIRRYIAETMKRGTLIENDVLRRSYLEYIQEQLVFLRQCHEESVGNDFLWDNLQFARYNFCMLIKSVAQDLHLSKHHELFDRNLRKEIFKLLSKWCEGENLLRDEQTRKKLNGFLAQVRDFSKRAEYEKMINEHTLVLQFATAVAISSLFLGPTFAEPPSVKEPVGIAFGWINKMMVRSREKLRVFARQALENLLKGNASNTDMILYAINQCYSLEPLIARGYFLGLVELFKDHDPIFPNSSSIVINLIIYKAGDSNSAVRHSAIQLLHLFQVQTMYEPPHVASYPSSIGSSVHETYHYSQLQLSERLARNHPELAYGIFTEAVYRLEDSTVAAKKQMLQCLVPWVETMDFAKLALSSVATQDAVVQSFLLATLQHVENHPHLIRQLWTSVGQRGRENVRFIFEHLLLIATKKQNPEFVALAKHIAIYLGRCAPATVVDLLVSELTLPAPVGSTTPPPQKLLSPPGDRGDRSMSVSGDRNPGNRSASIDKVDRGLGERSASVSAGSGPNAGLLPVPSVSTGLGDVGNGSSGLSNASGNKNSGDRGLNGNSGTIPAGVHIDDSPYDEFSSSWSGIALSQLFPSATAYIRSAFSQAMPEFIDNHPLSSMHIILILLSEIAFEVGDQFRRHLHVILQLVFLGFDHPHLPVYEHCRVLLLNLIYSLVIKRYQSMERDPAESPEFDEALQLAEFITAREGKQLWALEDVTMRKPEIQSAQELSSFVSRVVGVLGEEGGDLNEKWAAEALIWATKCPGHHIASRSYQIYRTLKASMSLDAIGDILHSLGVCLAMPTPENLGLTIEILHTLQVMVEWIPTSKLILFPQLFWGTVALLHSDYEVHFSESVKLLSKLVDRFNFSDRAVHNIFLASIPKAWAVPFAGVQPLVLRGLLSPVTEPDTIELLSKLTLTPFGEIFQADESRFLTNITAQLPWLVAHCNIEDDRTHICFTSAERISAACEIHGFNKLAKVFKKYAKGTFEDSGMFLMDLRKPLVDVVRTNDGYRVLSLLFKILDQGPTYSHQSTLQILTILLSGVDLSEKNIRSHLAAWVSIVARFVTGQIWKDASLVLEAILKSFPSPTQMDSGVVMRSQALSHAPTKPGFTNKPGPGVDHTLTELMKVLATTMGASTATSNSKAKKSPSATYEVFEKFFSFHDAAKERARAAAEGQLVRGTSKAKIEGKEADTSMFTGLMFGSRKHSLDDGDQDSVQDMKELTRANFYSFPSFHGFDDLMEGLEAQGMEEDSSGHMSTTSSHHSLSRNRVDSPMLLPMQHSHLPPRRLTKSGEFPTLTPHILSSSGTPLTHHHSPHPVQHNPNNNNNPNITNVMNMQNTSLAALIRASRTRWMQCSTQSTFESAAEQLCGAFVAASQLVHQLTLEFRTLHRQYLSILSDTLVLVLDSPVLRSEIFDLALFRPLVADTVGSMATMASGRFAELIEDPTYARSFNEQKERYVSVFTEQLNMYTEQKSVVATARAKLLETDEDNAIEDSPAYQGLREVRLALSVASLHYQLLLLWLANASLQSLLIDLTNVDELHEEKQRTAIESELSRNQIIINSLKEKEGLYINMMRRSRQLFFVDREHGGKGSDSDREYKDKDHKKKGRG